MKKFIYFLFLSIVPLLCNNFIAQPIMQRPTNYSVARNQYLAGHRTQISNQNPNFIDEQSQFNGQNFRASVPPLNQNNNQFINQNSMRPRVQRSNNYSFVRNQNLVNRRTQIPSQNANFIDEQDEFNDQDFSVPVPPLKQNNRLNDQDSIERQNTFNNAPHSQEFEARGELLDPGIKKSEIDAQRKMNEIKRLTGNAARHFLAVPLANACADFLYNPVWRKGELSIFVYDENGVNYVHGDDINNIWENISKIKSIGGTPLIKRLLQTDQNGKSIGYLWDNTYKSSYVRTVVKNGVKYVIGAGFFPEDNEFRTKELVKSAVSTYLSRGREETFALINNPEGPFVKGNIYPFVFNFQGRCLAHGENVALIGQDLIDLTDSRGEFLIRKLIAVAKRKGSGWVNYYWKNAFKRAYVERVVDPKTKQPFLISAGYYPYEDFQSLKSFVLRAVSFLKANGAAVAFPEFSNTVGSFAKGGFGIAVFDLDGKNVANGFVPEFVGQNLIKRTDFHGKYYFKEMIDTAKRYGKGIVTFVERNANAVAYVELVDIPDGKFVVLSKYYPASKTVSTQTLVEAALEYLKTHSMDDAFSQFSRRDGEFFQGDLHIFVYDDKGNRLVKGPNKENIWRNFMKTTDQDGRPIVNDFTITAINGGGWLEYKTRNARRRIYVKALNKLNKLGQPETFIVGSGYFL